MKLEVERRGQKKSAGRGTSGHTWKPDCAHRADKVATKLTATAQHMPPLM